MASPDFTKYDETQLKRILTRIDRKRFPGRVIAIEARLKEITADRPRNLIDTSIDFSGFDVKQFPGAPAKVFGLALPFFATAVILLLVVLCLDSTKHPASYAVASTTCWVAFLIGFAITYFRLCTLRCPECQHECKRSILGNGNWGAICYRCAVLWDTGIGSDA